MRDPWAACAPHDRALGTAQHREREQWTFSYTRECLALVAHTSLSGLRVGRELDRIVALRGRPAMIVSDNGTELTSHAMLCWQQERGVA